MGCSFFRSAPESACSRVIHRGMRYVWLPPLLMLVLAGCGAAATTSTSPSTSSAVRSGWTRFNDSNLGFTFDYPSRWGTLTVTPEDKQCFTSGEGRRFGFSGLATVGATMRSKDYVWSSACARGGSYIDSPAGYDGVANLRTQAWDPTMQSGRWSVLRAADRFIDALCNSVAKFVGLEAFVKLGGQKFDVVHFYQQLRSPTATGAGVDVTGCERGADLFAPISADFTDVVKSARNS